MAAGIIPFSVSEKRDFARFVFMLDPTNTIPSRRTVMRCILQMVDEENVYMKSVIG